MLSHVDVSHSQNVLNLVALLNKFRKYPGNYRTCILRNIHDVQHCKSSTILICCITIIPQYHELPFLLSHQDPPYTRGHYCALCDMMKNWNNYDSEIFCFTECNHNSRLQMILEEIIDLSLGTLMCIILIIQNFRTIMMSDTNWSTMKVSAGIRQTESSDLLIVQRIFVSEEQMILTTITQPWLHYINN